MPAMSPRRSPPPPTDPALSRALLTWFPAAARDLPWRTTPRDPYIALVSEAMLQQTQVSRVLEKFAPFIARFPTVVALAAAPEADVLAAWSGLGYYRRARSLHNAAREIVARFGAVVPGATADLLTLPGVGRYTAGAIASIVHGEPAPIVDGNIMRVLLRIHGRDLSPADPATVKWAWRRAESLVSAAATAGAEQGGAAAFNEGVMELGATVCTPRNPRCDVCPAVALCIAHREGAQDRIPRPRDRAERRTVFHTAVVIRDSRGRLLVQRRPETGLWAGMWQPPTIERDDRPATRHELAAITGRAALEPGPDFTHVTTHRLVRFSVWRRRIPPAPAAAARLERFGGWMAPETLAAAALANPHRRMLLGG